ncbi:hypothetical protein NP493_1423g01017 [Ridgeia piscesae]|uniref:Uncharacterized protein n=1 Tax=Ridgeia piscesae TaxID=27915 RepID=A0AAD9K5C4_RIDPI|nr:hypothetical protein NP493_1423g01017 [Ridgeia piscesae]
MVRFFLRSAKAAPAVPDTLYKSTAGSVSSQQKADNAKMAKKLLAVFAVCCLSAVFVSAKSTRNSDLPDAADFDWDHFSYGWGVGAGLFQVKTIVTDEKNHRFCEYKVREEHDEMAEELFRLSRHGQLNPDHSGWPGWHPAPARYTRLRLPVGSKSSAKKIMRKRCIQCFNCSENGMSCTKHDM